MSEVNENIEEEVVDNTVPNEEENNTETPAQDDNTETPTDSPTDDSNENENNEGGDDNQGEEGETQTDDNPSEDEPSGDEPTGDDEPEYHNEDIDPDNPINKDDEDASPEEIIKTIHKVDITGKINYVQLIIPGDYLPTYKKLLYALSKIGKQIMDDCAYSCKQGGHNIFVCWQLFQSAIAAYNIGETKKADLFIKYIDSQLPKSIRLEQVELDVIDHQYPNVNYYINDNGSTVFTLQAIYKGQVYQRTITLPMSGYIPPVVVKSVVYNNFTLETLSAFMNEKGYTSPFEITQEDLNSMPSAVSLEPGVYDKQYFDVIYIFIPTGISFDIVDFNNTSILNNFVEGETKKTTTDGVYYFYTEGMSNVTIKIN